VLWHKAELSWDETESDVVGRLFLNCWGLFSFNHYPAKNDSTVS
jgi:hypothetical protein